MNYSAKEQEGGLKAYMAMAWIAYLSGVAYIIFRILQLNQPDPVISVQQNFFQVVLPSIPISYGVAVSLFYLYSRKARQRGIRPRGFPLPWLIILLAPLPSIFGTIMGGGIGDAEYYGTILLIPFMAAAILVIWIDYNLRNELGHKN